MTWEEANNFCSILGAKMVVVESEQERKEITRMTASLIAKRRRFWLDVKLLSYRGWWSHGGTKTPTYTPWGTIKCNCKGACIRSGPDTMWYKAWCNSETTKDGSYTFNPLCFHPGGGPTWGRKYINRNSGPPKVGWGKHWARPHGNGDGWRRRRHWSHLMIIWTLAVTIIWTIIKLLLYPNQIFWDCC